MDVEKFEKRLELWKWGFWAAFGASVMLLATTLIESMLGVSWSWWILICVAIWLATAISGFHLLMSRKWRKVLLSDRLNVAFGYLVCAWLVLLNVGFKDYQICNQWVSKTNSGVWVCSNKFTNWDGFILITAFAMGAAYWYLRKKKDKPEEIFP